VLGDPVPAVLVLGGHARGAQDRDVAVRGRASKAMSLANARSRTPRFARSIASRSAMQWTTWSSLARRRDTGLSYPWGLTPKSVLDVRDPDDSQRDDHARIFIRFLIWAEVELDLAKSRNGLFDSHELAKPLMRRIANRDGTFHRLLEPQTESVSSTPGPTTSSLRAEAPELVPLDRRRRPWRREIAGREELHRHSPEITRLEQAHDLVGWCIADDAAAHLGVPRRDEGSVTLPDTRLAELRRQPLRPLLSPRAAELEGLS
jgi:hypothetical protein